MSSLRRNQTSAVRDINIIRNALYEEQHLLLSESNEENAQEQHPYRARRRSSVQYVEKKFMQSMSSPAGLISAPNVEQNFVFERMCEFFFSVNCLEFSLAIMS